MVDVPPQEGFNFRLHAFGLQGLASALSGFFGGMVRYLVLTVTVLAVLSQYLAPVKTDALKAVREALNGEPVKENAR